ncbi:hypothetical protein BJX76DRAFT_320333 [Aspergillus varians]
MENTHEIEDTGNKDDLDESDQRPVKASGLSETFCYICNGVFDAKRHELTTPGVYSVEAVVPDKEIPDWFYYYRLLLFHPRKRICHLSGVSNFVYTDYYFYTRQAPWDEHTSIVRTKSKPSMNENLVTALPHEFQHLSAKDRLTCLIIHARCWQLLCKHRIWSLSGGDIKIVMQTLYRRRIYHENHSVDPLVHNDWTSLEFVDLELDPFHSDRVQFIIRQARRRTRTKYRGIQYRHKQNYLNQVPPEILLLIVDFLPSTDIAAVQKAIGSYLGDVYWRSRIPDIFHEARDVSSESLNWEYLCMKLEELKTRWTISPPNRLDALEQLDQTAEFIADGSNST